MSPERTTLILAIGNPARLDDGLGPSFAAAIERRDVETGATAGRAATNSAAETVSQPEPDVEVCWDYHLQIEQAEDVARAERVIFVDADRIGPAPFSLRRVEPSQEPVRFTSHGVSPSGLLGLTEELHGRRPEAWILGIRGYEFDGFGERLSGGARDNLTAALDHISRLLGISETSRPAGREHA